MLWIRISVEKTARPYPMCQPEQNFSFGKQKIGIRINQPYH